MSKSLNRDLKSNFKHKGDGDGDSTRCIFLPKDVPMKVERIGESCGRDKGRE